MKQKIQSRQPYLIAVISVSVIIAGLGIYFFIHESEPKLAESNDSILHTSSNKEDFDDYIYALNRIAEAHNIGMEDMKETYRKMDTGNISKTTEDFKKSLVYTNELISEYKEINVRYQLAKNKLDTIKNLELKDSIFDLTQALILYTEINNEKIKFYQHLYSVYILNQKDDYQEGNKPDVNTAFSLLEDSFTKMDKVISTDFGAFLDSKNMDDYRNFRDIILTVD